MGEQRIQQIGDVAQIRAAATSGATGAVWRVEVQPRHLDANVIHLPPGDSIAMHTGPDLDVLLHVLDGDGHIDTGDDPLPLTAGTLIWLPRGSRRAIVAGPGGLTYFSVHPRKDPLTIGRPDQPAG
ncbi:MAG: cupin domain-containing protein [Hamadaea sp.]|nr:cupin domain-containing protein [Hamadaea sp.]